MPFDGEGGSFSRQPSRQRHPIRQQTEDPIYQNQQQVKQQQHKMLLRENSSDSHNKVTPTSSTHHIITPTSSQLHLSTSSVNVSHHSIPIGQIQQGKYNLMCYYSMSLKCEQQIHYQRIHQLILYMIKQSLYL